MEGKIFKMTKKKTATKQQPKKLVQLFTNGSTTFIAIVTHRTLTATTIESPVNVIYDKQEKKLMLEICDWVAASSDKMFHIANNMFMVSEPNPQLVSYYLAQIQPKPATKKQTSKKPATTATIEKDS